MRSSEHFFILIFFTDLSEETKDDRTTTSTHMAGIVYLNETFILSYAHMIDSMINICIVNVEEDMSTSYCIFIIMLASFLIYLCWPIFLYGFVLYQLITYDNPSDRKSSVHRGSWSSPCEILSHSVSSSSSLFQVFCVDWEMPK